MGAILGSVQAPLTALQFQVLPLLLGPREVNLVALVALHQVELVLQSILVVQGLMVEEVPQDQMVMAGREVLCPMFFGMVMEAVEVMAEEVLGLMALLAAVPLLVEQVVTIQVVPVGVRELRVLYPAQTAPMAVVEAEVVPHRAGPANKDATGLMALNGMLRTVPAAVAAVATLILLLVAILVSMVEALVIENSAHRHLTLEVLPALTALFV